MYSKSNIQTKPVIIIQEAKKIPAQEIQLVSFLQATIFYTLKGEKKKKNYKIFLHTYVIQVSFNLGGIIAE